MRTIVNLSKVIFWITIMAIASAGNTYAGSICKFYEHIDARGSSFEGTTGRHRSVGNWNDQISSVWVADGYTLVIYEHSGLSGKKQLFSGKSGGALYNLTDFDFNDIMSSYKLVQDEDRSDRKKRRRDDDKHDRSDNRRDDRGKRHKDDRYNKRSSRDICRFYEDINGSGDTFEADTDSESVIKPWNDRISSIWIAKGYTVTVYEHSRFSGKSRTFTGKNRGTLYNLTNYNFNDEISSYKIWKGSNRDSDDSDRKHPRDDDWQDRNDRSDKDYPYDRGKRDKDKKDDRSDNRKSGSDICRFYEDANGRGDMFEADNTGRQNVKNGWNNRISSIWIADGYTVTVYDRADFSGRRRTFFGNGGGTLYDLSRYDFNDRVSSYKIRWGRGRNSDDSDKKYPRNENRQRDRDTPHDWGKRNKKDDRSDNRKSGGNICRFYENANGSGNVFEAGTGRQNVKSGWNNKISSIWIADGYSVTIYDRSDFTGKSRTFNGNSGGTLYNLSRYDFNDRVSAYEIRQRSNVSSDTKKDSPHNQGKRYK